MSDTNPRALGDIDEDELISIVATMGAACDVVRTIDPSTMDARTLNGEGTAFNEPYLCYTALGHDRRCENCISMRAVDENRPVSKFEFVDGDAYFITARPMRYRNRPLVLEMVQKVSDDVGIHDGLEELQEHVQAETDHEFVDGFTGAYSRNYFDEGLHSMQGRKFAIVKVDNLGIINRDEGYPAGDLVLKRIAHEILANTRIEDSVIHYKGNKFAVQFEDMESEEFPAVIQRIYDAVNAVTIETHPHLHPMAYVVAVDEDGTYGELAERALSLLAECEESETRLAVRSSDEHHHAAAHARAAVAAEALHHSADKLIVDTDELTGLATSSAIRAHIQRIVEERHEREDGYCVIYLDVENFKQFNRAYGTSGGDMLLEFMAERIREEFPAATAARMSGDLFVIVTNEPDVKARLDRLHDAVAAYQNRITCELKAGVFEMDRATHDAAAAIDLAKVACESIKGRFDLSVRFYDSELDQEISMNEYVVNNIDRALAEGHIKVFYQPIIRTMTGHVCDFEALARWDDPQHGLLPPDSFIGALERFHLINKLDAYIVNEVCRHQAEVIASGKPPVPTSVNLSRLDFQLGDIFATVEEAVAAAGIPRSMLNVEVTESALDDDSDYFAQQVERFRNAGYEVWMDDFGSGYSSLNLLKDYRFDTLKIDMAFLAGFEHNPKSREIIVTIVDMAKKLGIRTLIEGVETKQQYRFLQRIGCEMLQGFYFGKPRPYDEDEFVEFTVEDARERAYFDELGSVNLLGSPAGDGAGAAGNVTESETRSVPMAIVEHRGGAYSYLSANEAYLEVLEGAQFGSLDELQEAISAGLFSLSERMVNHLDEARLAARELVRTHALASGDYQIHVRHITAGPGAEAYMIVPVRMA